jgi:hypothetical protein
MIFPDDRTTNDALLNTLGDELAAAWVRFYAIDGDHESPSSPQQIVNTD